MVSRKAFVFAFGFDHAHGFSLHKKHVIRRADVGLVLPYRHAHALIYSNPKPPDP